MPFFTHAQQRIIFVYASGCEKTASLVELKSAPPLCGFFSATFLGLLELLRNSLIATPKTS
jgi:hypothetical protein